MDGIMADPSALTELREFNALNLNPLESLTDHHMPAEGVAGTLAVVIDARGLRRRLRKRRAVGVARRDDADAAGQQGYGCARLDSAAHQLWVEVVFDTIG